MIDPDERVGRMGDFIGRIAESNRSIDPSRPIPLDRLTDAMDRYRQERMRGDSGGDRDSDRGSDRGGSSSRSSSNNEPQPLVPGFGIDEAPLPPAGFGTAGELFVIAVTDADKREADERMGRYDRNKDGRLSKEEIGGGRWSDDPFQYDANRDGYLTASELSVRYARRRVDRESSSSNSSNSSSDSRSRFGSSSYSSRGREDDRRGGDDGRSRYSFSRDDEERDGGSSKSRLARTYRFLSPEERLPKGLPDWFASVDQDLDGQVLMAEFAEDWNDSVAANFEAFDINGDGLITPQECLSASANGVTRGGTSSSSSRSSYGSRGSYSGGGSSSAAETSSSADAADMVTARATGEPKENGELKGTTASAAEATATPSDAAPAAAPAAATEQVDPRYLKYGEGFVEKYDANKDGLLTPDEWKESSSSDVSQADFDSNGSVSPYEYALYTQRRAKR